jgi:hypothetical protein
MEASPGDFLEMLGALAERYVKAVAGRNRFSHQYGLKLADAVLEEAQRARQAQQLVRKGA